MTMDATTALAIYRAEKDKALRERRVSHVQLMAEAQEAFRKMLADAQLARKGGRPKGSTNAAPPAVVAVAPAPAVVPGKLVIKKPKSAAPAKQPEKVTATAATSKVAKPSKAGRPENAAKVTAKRSAPKRAVAEKRQVTAKAPRRASAAARKGSAKKAAPARKQAAARERRPKTRRR
jgi:hypothetical protein